MTTTIAAPATRRVHEGYRTGFGSLAAGGLNWDNVPLRLFAGGNAKFWNPADLDFSQDAVDWKGMEEDDRFFATLLCAQFIAGEEAVTEDIQPFLRAMQAEGRLGDEMYLTQFAFEEAKHMQAFRLWMDAVGLDEDLNELVEGNAGYRKIFYQALPQTLQALESDPSPAAQVRASVTYNHVVEGMLALTGYYVWNKVCKEQGVLPGMQAIVKHIGDDERRHMAWGTFTCRRHVAADDANWEVVQEQMQALLPAAIELVQHPFTLMEERGIEEDPFGMDQDEITQYALDKGTRRLGTIESARGRRLAEIDLDFEPMDLEDRFAEEDARVFAEAEAA